MHSEDIFYVIQFWLSISKGWISFKINSWTVEIYVIKNKGIMGIASMNLSLNTNRKLLKSGKRTPFTKMNGGAKKKSNYKVYVLPQIPPHMLRRVRLRIRKQNQRRFKRQMVVGGLSILILILYIAIVSIH
jgi:hypothetical protein